MTEEEQRAYDEGYQAGHGDALKMMGVNAASEEDEEGKSRRSLDAVIREVKDSGRMLYTQREVYDLLYSLK